jgi:hypothetical protein
VIACFGLTVNVALMLAESPVLISPAQRPTLFGAAQDASAAHRA